MLPSLPPTNCHSLLSVKQNNPVPIVDSFLKTQSPIYIQDLSTPENKLKQWESSILNYDDIQFEEDTAVTEGDNLERNNIERKINECS